MSDLAFYILRARYTIIKQKIKIMKFKNLCFFLLSLAIYSCSEDAAEITETEIEEFVPGETGQSSNILADYPNGIISIDYNGQMEIIEKASAIATPSETLIISEFVDDVTGDPTKLLIGVKGFSEGDFKGNVLGYNLLPNDYDLADITITEYGEVGGVISGSFSVSYSQLGNQITVSGDFNGLRIN